MKSVPFWHDDFPIPSDLPRQGLPERVDVAVVGAGITGLMAARRLARTGAAVAVLEAGRIGSGASSISGGMTIYGPKAGARQLFATVGEERAREIWQANLDCIDRVAKVIAEEGIDCDFHRGGAVQLGFTAKDATKLREQSRWLRTTFGFDTTFHAGDLTGVVGGTRFSAALVDEVSGGLHPAKYTYGLAAAAARAGAALVEHAAVRGATRTATGFRLHTDLGPVDANDVLWATNGYTGPALPELRRRIVPVGSYIVVTEPLDPEVAERLIPRNRMMWTARRFLNYFRRTPDGRLLMGGRHDLRTGLDLQRSAAELRRVILDFFPELEGAPITHTWSGQVGVTFDLNPHIGRIAGMWYALGYSGHGMAVATYLGDEVGAMMAGEVDRSVFADIDHPTRWFYRRRPWFLPAAARWYRLLDRIGH